MRKGMYNVADGVLILAMLFVAIVVLHRKFESAERTGQDVRRIDQWDELAAASLWIGAPDAPIRIIEFADLECPACGSFHPRLQRLRKQYGDRVAVGFAHYPLTRHNFALAASRALECVAERSDPWAFMAAVYSKQDSLGLKSWSSYSEDAGDEQSDDVDGCVESEREFPRIDAGIRLARAIGVPGTPALVVNGWLLRPDAGFEAAVARLAAGNPPVTSSIR